MAVIGLGSNLLVADEGYDGVAVRLEGALAAIEIDGASVRCGGGASLAAVVRRCTEAALAGIEFGCAIPGTVGGAVRMNAGAYGSEIRDVLALGRRRLGARRAQRRPARARAQLPAFERARLRGRRPSRAAARAGVRDEIRRTGARDAAPPQRQPAAQGAHVRLGLQEPRRGPGRRRADRGLWPQGARDRRRAASPACTRTSSRTPAVRARPTSRRWSRSPVGACASASSVELEHEVELLGPITLA